MTYSVTPKRAIQYYALGDLKLVVKTPLLSQRLHTGRLDRFFEAIWVYEEGFKFYQRIVP